MLIVANTLIGFMAIEHIAFLVLEMFLWTHPIGLKIFGRTPAVAESSKVLAANQGLYNGFLAAGLIWGLISSDWSVKVFFASCVLVAGLYGGYSVKKSILVVQALPALIALAALFAT
jgi:putative membrane protein